MSNVTARKDAKRHGASAAAYKTGLFVCIKDANCCIAAIIFTFERGQCARACA